MHSNAHRGGSRPALHIKQTHETDINTNQITTAWERAIIDIPRHGGLPGALEEDVWVDVLRIGTIGFHTDLRTYIHTRTRAWRDFWVGRFLPVGNHGVEDLRFAAAAYYAGVPKLAAYHVEGMLFCCVYVSVYVCVLK